VQGTYRRNLAFELIPENRYEPTAPGSVTQRLAQLEQQKQIILEKYSKAERTAV
jgi:hypothetical protein